MRELPRPSLLYFSHWIFAWVILFIFGIIQYSPKFILSLALLYVVYEINILASPRFFYYNLFNVATKLIALGLVFNSEFHIIPSVVLLLLYVVYIYCINRTIMSIYGADAIRLRAESRVSAN